MSSESSSSNRNLWSRIKKFLDRLIIVNQDQTESLRKIVVILSKDQNVGDELVVKPNTGLLDSDELMKLLRISRSSYYRLRKDGQIRPIRIGGRDYYDQEEIDRLLREGRKRL